MFSGFLVTRKFDDIRRLTDQALNIGLAPVQEGFCVPYHEPSLS